MTENGYGPTPGPQYNAPNPMPPLRRSRSDRMIAGVCGGLARSLDVDPTLVRVLAVVAGFVTGGAAVIAYLVAIVVIPDDRTAGYPPAWQPYEGYQPYATVPPTAPQGTGTSSTDDTDGTTR